MKIFNPNKNPMLMDSVFSPVQMGDTGQIVRWLQELLTLRGFGLIIDGEYGPATRAALSKITTLGPNGLVSKSVWEDLVAPLKEASSLHGLKVDFPEAIVFYARQHLASKPREVGGENSGPWVRMYMDGNQGAQWPWCAGFATYVVAQAAEDLTLSLPPAVRRTYSCDLLGARAEAVSKLVTAANRSANLRSVYPGCIFLIRKSDHDWIHTGIVTRVLADSFETIEGNTNSTGGREGFEVCTHIRAFRNVDFIQV